jgi:hypothetical protein
LVAKSLEMVSRDRLLRESLSIRQWAIVILLGIAWNFASIFSWSCIDWIPTCPVIIPWGNIGCTCIGLCVCYFIVPRTGAILTTLLICGVASIKILSSVKLVYIAVAVVIAMINLYKWVDAPHLRDYTRLSPEFP